MDDEFEVIDLSDEQSDGSYEHEKSHHEVKPSFKKPSKPVSYVSESGFRMPIRLGEVTNREESRLPTSVEDEIPLVSRSEAWTSGSRPATNSFAQQRPRSSKSTSPNHGNLSRPTNKDINNMACGSEAYVTPGKKRRIDSVATDSPNGNSLLPWAPDLPPPVNPTANTSYQPITPDRTPARQSPAQHGMFSKQARSQRNGKQVTLQPAPPGLDQQAAADQAVTWLSNIEEYFLRPMIDLTKKVNTLEARNAALETRVEKVENENATLRQHVDASFVDQASKTQKAVSDVNKSVEELHVRVDDLEGGGDPAPGGPYGGPRMTGPSKQPSVFNGLLGGSDGA